MNKSLFFDLDGTLLDIKQRHVSVYHIVAKSMRLPIVPDDEYWERKRNHQFPWDDVPDDICQLFRKNFKLESELPFHLKLDTVFPNIISLLQYTQHQWSNVLLTKRYSREHLLHQLDRLSLSPLFTDILTPDPGSKVDAVKMYKYEPTDMVIGDTEEDILTAQQLSLASVAVTWGMRTENYLQTFRPTDVATTIEELQSCIETT